MYWIERNTWGKNTGTPLKIVRPEWAKLSLAQLAKLCGSDRRTVARSMADLVTRGIIEDRDRTGCGATVAKMYKLTPARWKAAPYYEPAVMEEEDAPELDEEEAADTTEPVQASDELEATVQPGKVSRPQPIAISPAGGAPHVTIRVVYRSVDLPFPVAFKAHPGRNGRVQITCRATAPQFSAFCSPIISPVTVESNQFKSYRDHLEPFVLNFWGKALDEVLLNQIVRASNGAPVSVFENIVLKKFKNSRKAEGHKTGLLVNLAEDAAKAWAIQQRQPKAQQTRRAEDAAADQCDLCSGRGSLPSGQVDPLGAATLGPDCPDCGGTGTRIHARTKAA